MTPRGIAFVLIALAACYAPTAPSGAPCASNGSARCPSGQACALVDGTELCVRPDEVPVVDAPSLDPDARLPNDAPADDLDVDGIPNAKDNCPLTANATQRDHDGDERGDACDGCPHLPAAAPLDADQDGVEDACDPHPMTGGDRIARFEDFIDPLPMDWRVNGPWRIDAGQLVIEADSVSRSSLAAPGMAPASATVIVQITPLDTSPLLSSGVGIAIPLDRADVDEGIGCQLMFSSGDPRLGLVDYRQNQALSSRGFNWDVGRSYLLTLTREASSYVCSATGAVGGSESVTATRALDVPQPTLGIRTRAVSATFEYLLVIESGP